MRIITTLGLLFASVLPMLGQVFPASTNGNNVFTGTNTFTVGTRTFKHDGSHTVITNTATLTSTEFTAGQEKKWYNGATTVLIDDTNGIITANLIGSATSATNVVSGGSVTTGNLSAGTNLSVIVNSSTANLVVAAGNASTLVVSNATVGIGKAPSAATLDVNGSISASPTGFRSSGTTVLDTSGKTVTLGDSSSWTNITFFISGWFNVWSNGNVFTAGSMNATNGLVLRQLALIPTNWIPVSDVSNLITNFLEVNMTNTFNGGGRMLLWSNNVSGGIFSRKTLQTDTQL